jgi:Protein of unknown function (DUF2750)
LIAAVNRKEFQHVRSLPADGRYEYFVKKVCDWQQVWGLWNEGWAIMADTEGKEVFPVWPHPIYAEAYAIGEWKGYRPREIRLQDWLGKWLPGLENDGRLIAIFPSTEGQPPTVNSNQLRADIEEECSKYD